MANPKSIKNKIKRVENQIKKHSLNPEIVKKLESKKAGIKEINKKRK